MKNRIAILTAAISNLGIDISKNEAQEILTILDDVKEVKVFKPDDLQTFFPPHRKEYALSKVELPNVEPSEVQSQNRKQAWYVPKSIGKPCKSKKFRK